MTVVAPRALPPMTREEARRCCERIKAHLGDARSSLLELYQRDGWRPLGYTSWRECATEEFDLSEQRVYQLLTAARIEEDISTVVELPERVLRPLGPLDSDERREVWEAASREAAPETPTAKQVEDAVKALRLRGLDLPAEIQAKAANLVNQSHVAEESQRQSRDKEESASATWDRAVCRLRQSLRAFRKLPKARAIVQHLEAAQAVVREVETEESGHGTG